MKLVTLNIQHGGGRRVPKILAYLRSQSADVIVLTEFREDANARALRSDLGTEGFLHFAAASIGAKENSVCIFSRQAFVPRTYPELPLQDRHRLISAHFNGLAIFGVYFSQNRAKAGLFQFLLNGKHRPTEAAYIVVGDFNTGLHGIDEAGSTFYCADEFAALSHSGLVDSWRSRNLGQKIFSWYSNHGNGFRIDHVFSSPEADGAIQRVYYDLTPRESGVTDHAALVVEHAS
jgi:exodeoxyribonuclease III